LLHLVGINSFECTMLHGLTNPKFTEKGLPTFRECVESPLSQPTKYGQTKCVFKSAAIDILYVTAHWKNGVHIIPVLDQIEGWAVDFRESKCFLIGLEILMGMNNYKISSNLVTNLLIIYFLILRFPD